MEVLPFGENGLPFAKSLTDAEGWARSERAWQRFLRIQPDGFFQALLGGTPVGIVGIFCYERVAWIHSLIVVQSHRSEGVGSRLVGFCCEEVTRRGIRALKLDAAPGTNSFYERLDWRSEFPSLRFIGMGRRIPHTGRPLRNDEIEAVVELDRIALGFDRSRLLHELGRDEPEGAFAVGPIGSPEGYVFSAQAEGRVEIGPIVVPSGNVNIARELMSTVLDRWPGQRIRCCVVGTHSKAVALMREFGFEEEPPSTRMGLGDVFPEAAAQFVMAGPAEG